MYIHYNETTNRITGFTNFIFEVPEIWDEPTIEMDFNFVHPADEYQLQNGTPTHIGKSQETLDAEFEKSIEDWKAQRQITLDNLEVTYYGVIYQGDEVSQGRMSRAINALPDDITELPWVAKDNTTHLLNRVDLAAILLDAGLQQSTIWSEGRPTQ